MQISLVIKGYSGKTSKLGGQALSSPLSSRPAINDGSESYAGPQGVIRPSRYHYLDGKEYVLGLRYK